MKKVEVTVDATVMVFKSDNSATQYVAPTEKIEWLAFRDRFGHDAKQCTPVELDGWGKKYYAVWVADCFDPPIAIVRADNESEAQEAFADELDWAHVAEPDIGDYKEDALYCNNSMIMYDPESIQMMEVKLTQVLCD